MDNLDLAQEAIKKGERAKVLFELLLSEIGCIENVGKEFWNKLKETQDEYNEAIKMLASIVQYNGVKKTHQKSLHEEMIQESEKTGDTYTNGDYK